MGQGLGRAALVAQGVGQVIVGHGEIGPSLDRQAELGNGLSRLAQALQGQAEVVGGLGVLRLEVQGGAAAAGGPRIIARGPVGFRQVGVQRGGGGIDRDGPADELDGPRGVALLEGRHAQEVQGVDVLRVACQDGLVG